MSQPFVSSWKGDVYVSMRLSATLACHMRLERFPMDVQVRKSMFSMMWQKWKLGL